MTRFRPLRWLAALLMRGGVSPRSAAAGDEERLAGLSHRLLRPGDLVIDIGAGDGRSALDLARAVAPTGIVYAFEPFPAGRDALAAVLEAPANALLKPLIVLSPLAIAPAPRKREAPDHADTLDGLFAGLPECHLLRIGPADGWLDLLRAGVDLLTRTRPVVAFAWSGTVRPAAARRFFRRMHYELLDLGRPAAAGALARACLAVPAERLDLCEAVAAVAGLQLASSRAGGSGF